MLCPDTTITRSRDMRGASAYLTAPFLIPRQVTKSNPFKISNKVECTAYAKKPNEVYNITTAPLYIKSIDAFYDGQQAGGKGHVILDVESNSGLVDQVTCEVSSGIPTTYTLGDFQNDSAGQYLSVDWHNVYNSDCNTSEVEQ